MMLNEWVGKLDFFLCVRFNIWHVRTYRNKTFWVGNISLSLIGSIEILTNRTRGCRVYMPYLFTIASLGHVICSIGSFKN